MKLLLLVELQRWTKFKHSMRLMMYAYGLEKIWRSKDWKWEISGSHSLQSTLMAWYAVGQAFEHSYKYPRCIVQLFILVLYIIFNPGQHQHCCARAEGGEDGESSCAKRWERSVPGIWSQQPKCACASTSRQVCYCASTSRWVCACASTLVCAFAKPRWVCADLKCASRKCVLVKTCAATTLGQTNNSVHVSFKEECDNVKELCAQEYLWRVCCIFTIREYF